MDTKEPVRLVPNYHVESTTVHLRSVDEVNEEKAKEGRNKSNIRHVELKERVDRSRSTSSSRRYQWKGTPPVTETVSLVANESSNAEETSVKLTPRHKPLSNDFCDP